MSVAGDMLQLLALLLSSHVRPSLVLRSFLPGSYTNLLLLPVLKLLRSCKWSWALLLWLLWSVLSPLSCTGLSLMMLLGLLRLSQGACACSFDIEFTSPFSILETFASTCAQQLFVLASVSSDRLGGAVAIGDGQGSGSL